MYNQRKPYSCAAFAKSCRTTYTGQLWLHQLPWYRISEITSLYNIEARRDYFLAMLMFKSILGIAPAYLCNQIVMNFDINGYDTRGTDGMNVYLPTLKKDIYKNSFLYKGGQVWNRIPDVFKDSPNSETFKYHYKSQKSVTDAWILYSCIHVSILQCKGKSLNIITPRINYQCIYVL